jgi:hypothetical protein
LIGVVGSDFEAHDSVRFFSPGGQHENGYARKFSDASTDFEAIEVRKRNVENDGVEIVLRKRRESGVCTMLRNDIETSASEILSEHVCERLVVIEDLDAVVTFFFLRGA